MRAIRGPQLCRLCAAVGQVAITGALPLVSAWRLSSQDVGGIAVGDRVPRIIESDLTGSRVTLFTSRARPTLVELLATWGEHCERLESKMTRAFAQFGHAVPFYAVAVIVNECMGA